MAGTVTGRSRVAMKKRCGSPPNADMGPAEVREYCLLQRHRPARGVRCLNRGFVELCANMGKVAIDAGLLGGGRALAMATRIASAQANMPTACVGRPCARSRDPCRVRSSTNSRRLRTCNGRASTQSARVREQVLGREMSLYCGDSATSLPSRA
jgi:hypothetical protein